MKYNRLAVALLLITASLFPAKVVITGFKDTDPKTEFITSSFVNFLRGNLEEAGFELADDKTEGLEYDILKHGNFFLASKAFFELYENIELDNSIRGDIKFQGKFFYLTVQVYSREKKKLVLKAETKGSKDALLAFYYEITKNIISSMDVNHTVKNIFPVDDDKFFFKYIKFVNDAEKLFTNEDPETYHTLMDELSAMENKFTEFPAFRELYDELMAQSEDFETPGPFEKPLTNITKTAFQEDNETERYARNLIAGGYFFTFTENVIQDSDEKKNLINLTVKFDLKLKKSSRNTLVSEIKKRKGNPHFADLGRYFFSQNESENKSFRDFLLRQSAWLRFYDSEGALVAESEYYFDKRQYSNGVYRHAKDLPFPLTPRGPANTAFGIKNGSRIQFLFEDIKRSDLARIARAEIELKFE